MAPCEQEGFVISENESYSHVVRPDWPTRENDGMCSMQAAVVSNSGCEALLVWQLGPSIYRRVLDIGNFQRFGEGLAHLFGHINQTEGRQGRKLLTIADRSVTKVNVPRMFAMASCSLRLL